MEKIYSIDPGKANSRVLVGEYDDSVKTFYRETVERHIMRIAGNSFGLQEDVIPRLEAKGCTDLIFRHYDGRTFCSKMEDWKEMKIANYGHGRQYFHPVDKMEVLEEAV